MTTQSDIAPGPQHGRWMTAGVIVLAIALTMMRRPNHLNFPELWVEDARDLVPQFLDYGWFTLITPVNGYLILPSKFLSIIAGHISFLHYPVTLYIFTLGSMGVFAAAVLKAPTLIPFRPIAALTPFLIPFGPEGVGIGLYTFWFFGIFSILALFWREGEARRTRLAFATFGGLSGPLGVSLVPLFLIRALARRKLDDWLAFAATAATGILQIALYVTTYETKTNYLPQLFEKPFDNAVMFVSKFVSSLFWSEEPIALLGVIVLMVAVCWSYADALQGRFVATGLVICGMISAVLSIIRVPLDVIDPVYAGMRYFFYPFIFFVWAGLAYWSDPSRRKLLTGAGILILLNTLRAPIQVHEDLDWQGAAQACLAEPGEHAFPAHFSGKADNIWTLYLSHEDCEKFAQRSLFP